MTLHERRAIVVFLDALALGLGLLLGEGLIRWFAAACNHTLLDGHAARRPATDLLLLTQLFPLDALNAADNFLFVPVQVSCKSCKCPFSLFKLVDSNGDLRQVLDENFKK
jgi:hypothetical protein